MCRDLIDILNDYGLEQVVEKPNRGDNILDILFIKNPTLVVRSTIIPCVSDHDGIPTALVNTNPAVVKQKPRNVYLYTKADIPQLKSEATKISSDFKANDLS